MAFITTAARSELIALYVAMFKAAPGAHNLTDMVTAYEAGGTTNTIAKTLAAKADYATVYPGFTTAQEFSASLVATLLGSDVTAAITTWATDYVVGLLNAGQSRADATVTAVKALRATTNTEFTVAQATLANEVDVASYYSMTKGLGTATTTLATLQGVIAGITSVAATVAAAKASADVVAVVPGLPFTLTTGIDNFPGTAGDDRFVATPAAGIDTFTALDAINGGQGNDILSVAAVAALTIPAGAKVIDVESATLASNTSVTADVSTWTGLTSLLVSSGGATTVTAAATTNVTELGSVAASTITGGKDVTVTHATAGTVTVDTAAGAVNITNNLIGGATNIGVTNAATAVKGAVTVAAKGDVSVAGGTTHDITFTESSAYAARVANAAAKISTAATATSASLAAGATGAAQVKAAGLAVLTTELTAATTVATNDAATLKALNGGHITTAQKVAIDAAFITAIKVPGAVAATAVAAALAVLTPITTAAGNAVVAATAASTSAAAASAAATTLNAIDLTGGLGQPNRSLTDTSVNNTALTSVKVTGGYGTGAANITGTALTTVTLDNAAPATLTSNLLTNVSVSNVVGATGNVTINNATVGHTQNLTLSNVGTPATSTVAAARFTATDNAATTVNLVSNGTANNVILAAPAATALNLTGAGAFDGVVAAVAASTAASVGGAAGVYTAATLASSALTLATNAVITATNSSGANNVLISAGQSYLGGSGADTVTTGAAVQTVAVSGGEGVADKLIVTNLTNIGVNADGTGSAKFTGFETLETRVTGTIDLATTLKGNTLTSVIINPIVAADGTGGHASATISGLNATTQAVTISTQPNATGYVLGVTGATSVGQLDALSVTAGAALGALSMAGVETLNITPTAGTSFNYGNAGALGTINVTGGSSAVYISGGAVALNPNTVIDASKGTGKAMLNIISATANGAKLVGSATANNLLTSNNSSSVLVGGAGNDILRGGNGDDTFTAGNGNNTVVTGNGINTVTLGNGMNLVTGGTGVDTITVGTGTNWIGTGGGLDVITLGAHALGNVHTIDLSAVADTSDVASVVTINGFVSGVDKINLVGGANTIGGLTFTVGTATQAVMLAPVTDVTSVATLAAVYTALASATGLNTTALLPASTDAAAGIVARTVTYPNGAAAGTYLVINDGNNAFQAATDIVIKLAAGTVVAAGDIIAGGTAYSVTPSQAFTATVGTDNFVGGEQNDTFAARFSGITTAGGGQITHVLNTFAAADVMNGGANLAATATVPGDVLTISTSGDNAQGTTAAITLVDTDFANISNIEGLTINSTGLAAQSLTLGTNYDNGFNVLTTSSTSGAITITATAVTTPGTFNATTTLTGGNIIIVADTASSVAQTINATVGSGALAGFANTSTIAITGNGGVDKITVNSGTAAAAGTGTVAIIGGAGADVISLGFGTGVTTITLDAIAVAGNVAGADVITGFTVTAGADVIRATDAAYAWFNGGTDGTVVLASGANMDALHAANNNFTVGTISTNVATHTVATYLAGASTIAQLEGTIATALGTATDGNFANTDNVLVAIDDGVSTMIVRVVSAANGNAIGDAEISLIGIISGLADATTLAAANFIFA